MKWLKRIFPRKATPSSGIITNPAGAKVTQPGVATFEVIAPMLVGKDKSGAVILAVPLADVAVAEVSEVKDESK